MKMQKIKEFKNLTMNYLIAVEGSEETWDLFTSLNKTFLCDPASPLYLKKVSVGEYSFADYVNLISDTKKGEKPARIKPQLAITSTLGTVFLAETVCEIAKRVMAGDFPIKISTELCSLYYMVSQPISELYSSDITEMCSSDILDDLGWYPPEADAKKYESYLPIITVINLLLFGVYDLLMHGELPNSNSVRLRVNSIWNILLYLAEV